MRRGMACFGVLLFLLTAVAASPDEARGYLSPGEIVASPDGQRLYVACEKSNEVRVLAVGTQSVQQRIAVGRAPRGLALSRDGGQILVANSWDDSVSVIDAKTLQVVRTLPTGAEPTSVVADFAGRT